MAASSDVRADVVPSFLLLLRLLLLLITSKDEEGGLDFLSATRQESLCVEVRGGAVGLLFLLAGPETRVNNKQVEEEPRFRGQEELSRCLVDGLLL